MAAAIATVMGLLEARHRWARAVMDAGNDTGANVKTAFASFSNPASPWCSAPPTFRRSTRSGLGRAALHGCIRVLGARRRLRPERRTSGRVASGALRVSAIQNDENLTQSFLEADKINTLRTHDGETVSTATNGYLKSASGSDFIYWDWGRVVDRRVPRRLRDAAALAAAQGAHPH
jgi:hypothetical protein